MIEILRNVRARAGERQSGLRARHRGGRANTTSHGWEVESGSLPGERGDPDNHAAPTKARPGRATAPASPGIGISGAHSKLTAWIECRTFQLMHALQFVQEFATFTGQDYATLRVIDRALADAGLRAKAKGKRMPDVTLDEGVMFLLAVLANTHPTRAAEAAQDIATFRIMSGRRAKGASILARIVGRPVAEMESMHLVEAVTAICRRLPGTDRWAELSVDRDGTAFIQVWPSADFGADGPAILWFVGLGPSRTPKMLTETRTAAPALLSWIGENTKGA